jgi:hypothetical protein
VLPLIASEGVEKSASSSKNKGSSNQAATITQVEFEIKPLGSNSIDCRKTDRWITVAIHTTSGFDATTVDPGSVTVTDGPKKVSYGGSREYGGEAGITLVAYQASNSNAYQWRWSLDDVDGDGDTDMVLEFRLDYVNLSCTTTTLAVSGNTTDGRHFESAHRVERISIQKR